MLGFQTEKQRERNTESLSKAALLCLLRILFSLRQVTFMAPSDRPPGTRQFWAWAQLSSGLALSVVWLKRGEKNNASHTEKEKTKVEKVGG